MPGRMPKQLAKFLQDKKKKAPKKPAAKKMKMGGAVKKPAKMKMGGAVKKPAKMKAGGMVKKPKY